LDEVRKLSVHNDQERSFVKYYSCKYFTTNRNKGKPSPSRMRGRGAESVLSTLFLNRKDIKYGKYEF